MGIGNKPGPCQNDCAQANEGTKPETPESAIRTGFVQDSFSIPLGPSPASLRRGQVAGAAIAEFTGRPLPLSRAGVVMTGFAPPD